MSYVDTFVKHDKFIRKTNTTTWTNMIQEPLASTAAVLAELQRTLTVDLQQQLPEIRLMFSECLDHITSQGACDGVMMYLFAC